MSIPVNITMGTFPANYCWTNPQTYADDLVALLTAIVPGSLNTFVMGNNTPQPSDQDKPWFRFNADGTPDKWYIYVGQWISLHPIPASSTVVQIWFGSESAAWSYDGGDGNDPSITPPTDTTGAMWKVEHGFDFLIPMGAGTSALGTVLAVNAQLGEEKHTLTTNEIPSHQHLLVNTDQGDPLAPGLNSNNSINHSAANGSSSLEYELSGSATTPTMGLSAATGGGAAHQNLPPVKGVYFIRRTARRFYTA